MSRRKHISLKTRCASLLLQLGVIPYDDAKLMTENQIISLFQVDHNILHESEHEDRDKFWNLTHRLIQEHRTKSKTDAAVIAKGRRIRKKFYPLAVLKEEGKPFDPWEPLSKLPKLRSRGFDKTKRRRMDGTVEKR